MDYYENLLRNLKKTIDAEVISELAKLNLKVSDANIPKKQMTQEQRRAKEIMAEIDNKYAEKKSILVKGYERAKTEEKVHYKQKDYRKYERLFETYAFPLNSLKFTEEDIEDVMTVL